MRNFANGTAPTKGVATGKLNLELKMRKTIFSLLLLAIGIMGAQAQSNEELDAKYTQGLLPVGTEAPDFVVKKSDNTNLSSYRTHQEGTLTRPGCYVLLDFWATWCGDCRKEIPTVKEIYKAYKNKVKLIGVSFDTDKDKLKEFRSKNEMKWTSVCNGKAWKDNPLSQAYRIQWIPTMYLIDPEGKVAYTTVIAENMAKKLEELDKAGKLTVYTKSAEYPGGKKAWQKKIDEAMDNYPEIAKKYDVDATVRVSFEIDENGKTSNIVAKSYEGKKIISPAFTKLSPQEQQDVEVQIKTALLQDVVRIMHEMTDNTLWIPAEERGKAIKSKMTRGIHFHTIHTAKIAKAKK